MFNIYYQQHERETMLNSQCQQRDASYRDSSLIRNTNPPRTTIGP